MTAYLQPGDKIFLTIPATGHRDGENAKDLKDAFSEEGIEVLHVFADPNGSLEVLAVIRPKQQGGSELL